MNSDHRSRVRVILYIGYDMMPPGNRTPDMMQPRRLSITIIIAYYGVGGTGIIDCGVVGAVAT